MIEERQKQFDQIASSQAAADAAIDVLHKSPDDARASLALGRHLCFIKQDWENGLPILAAAGDHRLD